MYLQGIPDIAILYKPPSNRDLEKALLSRRRRGGATLIPANFTGLVKLYAHLREGKGVGILPDQQPAPSPGEFVPFFGNQALTGYWCHGWCSGSIASWWRPFANDSRVDITGSSIAGR